MVPSHPITSGQRRLASWLRCLGVLWLICLPAWGQKQAWLPVTQQDWDIQAVPGNPGAPAILLYYAQHINDDEPNNEGEYIYQRIKVLSEKGKRYGDVEIRLSPGFALADLKARTIHPDGRIVEFAAKPYEKVIARGKGFRYLAKTFTMPEVMVGSILEYRYRLSYPPDELPIHEWLVQHELYTVKEEFSIRKYTGAIRGIEGPVSLALFKDLPRDAEVEEKGDGFSLQMAHVPAFEAEPYMPPLENFIYRVTMAYGGRELSSTEKFWQEAGRRWYDETERFIGDAKSVREAAAAAVGQEVDRERKLRKLYARAQQVRNLSFERERSEEERKRENLKINQNAADVLERGYGTHTDINRLFLGLARAAGFEASLLRAGNRSRRIFDRNVLNTVQLDGEIVAVKLSATTIYLDPGTRFCPFGLLRWFRTSTKALKLDRKGGTFLDIPGAAYYQAVISRAGDMTLEGDGTLHGDLTVRYDGAEALERRLEALETDEAGKSKALEDDVVEWLPPSAAVQLVTSQGWEDSAVPLEARFRIAVRGYASLAGQRLLAPVYPFATQQKEAFRQQERKFPVYFPFAFAEEDHFRLRVPEGTALESLPQQQSASIGYAAYSRTSRLDGRQVTTERVLKVNGIYFPPKQYAEIKAFFGKVQSGDEQPMVLGLGARGD
ncbi:MAG TPA: DUF3857 domain-containing protein [Candidatus Angelobacter sp.]|nr:DUF3857 domain-containing protein [Candidatus Angelobacter sp.]